MSCNRSDPSCINRPRDEKKKRIIRKHEEYPNQRQFIFVRAEPARD